MKRILFFTFFFLALIDIASAQTYVGGGAIVARSSSYDPSPAATGDGGQALKGVYVEAGYQFPAGLQARLLAEYLTDASLRSIFTSDAAVGKTASGEFRLRPELRLRPNCKEARYCLFIGGGVDYYRQRFETTGEQVRGASPASGLNPFFIVGADFGKSLEVNFRRLFADQSALNSSELRGYSAGAVYTRRLVGRFHLRIAGEADYVIYRDSIGYYVAGYEKRDAIFKLRGGLVFQ